MLQKTFQDWYVQEKTATTLGRIHRKFPEDVGYTNDRESLHNLLHTLRFWWRKTEIKRRPLMERHNNQDLRLIIFLTMKQYRGKGLPSVYMDKMYINSSHSHENAWCDENNKGLRKPVSKDNIQLQFMLDKKKVFLYQTRN